MKFRLWLGVLLFVVGSVCASAGIDPVGACCDNGVCLGVMEQVTCTQGHPTRQWYRDQACPANMLCRGSCCTDGDPPCVNDMTFEECGNGRYFGNETVCPASGICVPTLSEWGVRILGTAVVVAGVLLIQRKKLRSTV